MYVIKLNRDGPGINQSETKTVMAKRLTNRLSKPTRIKQRLRLCKPNRIEKKQTEAVGSRLLWKPTEVLFMSNPFSLTERKKERNQPRLERRQNFKGATNQGDPSK